MDSNTGNPSKTRGLDQLLCGTYSEVRQYNTETKGRHLSYTQGGRKTYEQHTARAGDAEVTTNHETRFTSCSGECEPSPEVAAVVPVPSKYDAPLR